MEGQKNTYRPTSLEDRILELRLESAAQKAGNTSQKSFTPQSIIPAPETLGLKDELVVQGLTPPFKMMEDPSDGGDLRMHLRLDGNVNDSTGNGNNGIATDISYFAGRVKNAAKLNGTSSAIRVVHSSSISVPDTTMTVSCWIKLNAIGSVQTFVSKWQCAPSPNEKGFGLEYNGTEAYFIVGDGAAIRFSAGYIIPSSWVGVWHNLIGYVRESAGTWYIGMDVDGVSTSENSFTVSPKPATVDLYVGRHSGCGAINLLNGGIDDVRLYARALSSSERVNIYNNGLIGIGSRISPPARADFGQF